MAFELNERKIIEVLSGVRMPKSDQAIIDAKDVSGIVIKGGHVSFTIEIDPKEKDKVDELRRACEQAVLELDAVLSATAMLTAHQSGPGLNVKADSNSGTVGTGRQVQNGPYQPATHVIAVASGKGGVGKSTTSINLALGLAALGKKVGILDADIYGPSLPRLIGLNRKPQSDGRKILPIEAWGLQTMSIGYLVAEDAPTIWRGPMVMSAIE